MLDYDEDEDMTEEALKKLISDMDSNDAEAMKRKAAGVTISISVAPGVDKEVLDAAKEDVVGDKDKLRKELGM